MLLVEYYYPCISSTSVGVRAVVHYKSVCSHELFAPVMIAGFKCCKVLCIVFCEPAKIRLLRNDHARYLGVHFKSSLNIGLWLIV